MKGYAYFLYVCARVLLTPASQSNGAAPSGPNTWPSLFNLSGDECAPETDFVHVFELQAEALSGQPGREAENLHLLLLPKRQQNKSSDAVKSKGVVRQIKKKERGKSKRGERNEEDGYSRDGLVCPPVFASISVLCALWITTTWSRRNFIMVAAFGCSLKDWSIWLRHGPAMLPMTPQNIQLLGSTEGAGGHQKKRIVALRKKKKKKRTVAQWMSSFSALSHHLICTGTKQCCDVYSNTAKIFINSYNRAYKPQGGLNNHGFSPIMI